MRPPFERGAVYRVRAAFEALRDRFEAGERLVYWRDAYSRYDGLWGLFFRVPGSDAVRSWDVPGEAEALRDWRTHFELVAAPDVLLAAAERGDVEVVTRRLREPLDDAALELLLRKMALEGAAAAGEAVVVARLLETVPHDDDHRRRLLHEAAAADRVAVVGVLLDAGVPVDLADRYGQTALTSAAFHGALDTVRLLLERGARAEATTEAGQSARSLAVARKHSEIVALLERHAAHGERS